MSNEEQTNQTAQDAQRPSEAGTTPCYPPWYVPGSMPPGWGLRRHVDGEIVVTHEDGSGVVIQEDGGRVMETLFYRMMNDILSGAGG